MPARVNGPEGSLRPTPRVMTEDGMLIRVRAFAVHIFTAAGAALALAALLYAARREWPAMFLCLGVALIIDGLEPRRRTMNRSTVLLVGIAALSIISTVAEAADGCGRG
jgi:phosphatidylcholine synthase